MEGRTTRSARKRLHEEALINNSKGSRVFLSDAALPTPPPSQPMTTRRWRGKRQYEDPLDQPPPTPSISEKKRTRYGDEVSYTSPMDPSCSSTTSLENPMSSYHNDDITLEFGVDFWQGVGVDGLASANDPFLPDADSSSTKGREELNTPPRLSPRDDFEVGSPSAADIATSTMPKTPMPRPGTPDYNPLASSMESTIAIPSLDQDEDDQDTSSLVGATALSTYGPPPTPMCPSRVGNLSSTSHSSTSSLLQLSTAIRNTPSTSAAPPLNILESDDDDNDEVVVVRINQNNCNTSKESQLNPHDNKNNLVPFNDSINEDNLAPTTGKKSFDSVDDPHSQSTCGFSTNSPPMSPPVSSAFKYSHRLRIRAPPPARSAHRRSDKSAKTHRSRESSLGSHSIKSILKSSRKNKHERTKASMLSRNSVEASISFPKEITEQRKSNTDTNVSNNGAQVSLMPPPKPPKRITTPLVSSSPSRESQSVTNISKENGALPISARTPACPTEISKNKTDVRDGNILLLKLNNFMAHHNRQWEFKRGVTFIHGKNGSGKSAIQLAIKLLVGEKAANTLRTSSVKNFIKKGYPYADIEGHFTNYSRTSTLSKYGPVIKLKRHIKSSGASTYFVVENGKWRPIKQYELGVITHTLNIDPDNPFQFLQQDRFKESSKPGSNQQAHRDFIKFKQATQLSAIENMLNTTRENMNVAKSKVQEKEDLRQFFALQEKQLKEELDHILKMEESENLLSDLELELEWAKVKVLKDEEKQIQAKKAKVYAEATELRKEKKKLEDDISNFSGLEEKNKKLLQEEKRRKKQLESEREDRVQEMRKVKQTQQRALSQHGTILTKIRQYTEEIEKLKRELNKETISYEEENQKHRAEIQEYRAMIEEKEGTLNELRNQRDKILGEMNEYKATLRIDQQRFNQLESQLNETRREISKKENFGRHMKELLGRIEKCKTWVKKPIGPLGQHITVPDAKYAPLIEYILYPALFTFVVQTREDFAKLKDLIKEVYNDKEKDKGKVRDPTVIQIPDINIKDYMHRLMRVKDKLRVFRTVLSMVSIKDPMVEIGMVERTNCERIILFDSYQKAAEIMKDDKKVPSEVISGYTLEWFKVTPYPRYQFQPVQGMPKSTTDIIPMAKGETTSKIKEELATKRQVIDTCKTNLKGLEKCLRQNDLEIQGVNKQINQLKNKIKYAESCIREEPTQDQDKDVADQIKMVEEMRAGREKEIQVPLKELELAKEKAAAIKEEIEKIDAQIPEVKRKLEELEGDQNGTNRTVAKLTKEIEEYKGKILRLDREFQSLGDAETKIYFDLGDLEKKASQTGPCPKVLNRDPDTVQRELENTKVFLEKNRDKLKSKRRVLSEYNNSKALVQQVTNEISLIEKLCEQFKPLIKVNSDYYEKLKKEMSRQITNNYRTLVEAHGLTGDLIVDWENETLLYYVCPDKNAEKKAKQSYSNKGGEVVVKDKLGVFNYVQNLSGGERSKALVFLLLAIWQITDMPFHMLDEFEACLDYESRQHIHDFVILHAERHPWSQFFFLTPLEIPPIPPEKRSLVDEIEIKKTK